MNMCMKVKMPQLQIYFIMTSCYILNVKTSIIKVGVLCKVFILIYGVKLCFFCVFFNNC